MLVCQTCQAFLRRCPVRNHFCQADRVGSNCPEEKEMPPPTGSCQKRSPSAFVFSVPPCEPLPPHPAWAQLFFLTRRHEAAKVLDWRNLHPPSLLRLLMVQSSLPCVVAKERRPTSVIQCQGAIATQRLGVSDRGEHVHNCRTRTDEAGDEF